MQESVGMGVATQTTGAALFTLPSLTQPSRLILGVTSPIEYPQPLLREDTHPIVRPFDWFTRLGRTEVGTVTLIHYDLGARWPILTPVSVSIAGSPSPGGHPWIGHRRILIFPSWGVGPMTKGSPSGDVSTWEDPHHITVQAGADGELEVHITQARDMTRTKLWHETKKFTIAQFDAILVTTLFFRQPEVIDRAGIAVVTFDDIRKMGLLECERHLSRFLAPLHPVLEPPAGSTWAEGSHLRIGLIVTPAGRLEDKDYPVVFGKVPRVLAKDTDHPARPVFRYTKIPILPTANLIVASAILPGELKQDIHYL